MELTPLVPEGRQVIERYGPSGFRVTGVIHYGSVVVFPDRTVPWGAHSASAVTWESLAPIIEHAGVRILLLGLGRSMTVLSDALRTSARAAGIGLEPMDTGAACRTYNVLMAEGRHVAAALIPPT